jgi:hypothetical protein
MLEPIEAIEAILLRHPRPPLMPAGRVSSSVVSLVAVLAIPDRDRRRHVRASRRGER